MCIGMSDIERFFGIVEWKVGMQLDFKRHNKSVTTYGISYVNNAVRRID
ncbi:hypothetical protein AGMMS49573_04600 [Endomicrobiia bacterium]|nr:hypothetical protein AGMMS49573_04600 [Endomicrobiia bacterium]